MYTIQVEGMTCGSCVGRVTKAVQGVDEDAKVQVDRASKTVQVDTELELHAVLAAIADAGYMAKPA